MAAVDCQPGRASSMLSTRSMLHFRAEKTIYEAEKNKSEIVTCSRIRQ